MAKEISYQPCPECGAFLRVIAQNVKVTLEKQTVRHPPDKPPGVGDWVTDDSCGHAHKVVTILPDGRFDVYWADGKNIATWIPGRGGFRIVRLRDAPLQKGDRGLLDGKIEVWFRMHTFYPDQYLVVFSPDNIHSSMSAIEYASINPNRFTLVEPVHESKEETDD